MGNVQEIYFGQRLGKLVQEHNDAGNILTPPSYQCTVFFLSLSEPHVVPSRLMSTQLLHLPGLCKSPP